MGGIKVTLPSGVEVDGNGKKRKRLKAKSDARLRFLASRGKVARKNGQLSGGRVHRRRWRRKTR